MTKSKHKINITKLWHDATAAQIESHASAEEGKLGSFRGGNTGVLLQKKDGTWSPAGKCHRRTLLRHLGVSAEKIPDDRHIMFDGGRNSEVVWMEKLQAIWPGKILAEEETPTRWETARGVPVTGRPDIVLCDEQGAPQVGLELKMASSLWTSRTVRIKKEPKFDHLTQSAHYSWQLGIPFKLCYIQYVDFSIGPGWEANKFPEYGTPGSEAIEYGEDWRSGQMTPKKIRPWMFVFDLRFNDAGVLEYRPENEPETDWVTTPISIDGIEDYYNYVDDMKHLKFLGPRPAGLTATGDKASFQLCNYCPLKPTCDQHETDYDRWLVETKVLAKEIDDE